MGDNLRDYLFYEEPGITLYCGDARAILPLLHCPNTTYCLEACDGRCSGVDFIFTDPPFGHNNNDGDLIHNREKALGRSVLHAASRPIANDGPEADELIQWAFKEFASLLADVTCPRRGCGAAVAVEVLGDDRHPPRWVCFSGHSGYFHAPAILTGHRPAPQGDPHSSRQRYTRCCSECGEPVKGTQRKCAECRRH